jgi:hypothetical protein
MAEDRLLGTNPLHPHGQAWYPQGIGIPVSPNLGRPGRSKRRLVTGRVGSCEGVGGSYVQIGQVARKGAGGGKVWKREGVRSRRSLSLG